MNITIIGGGPGGYVAALYAAKRGAACTIIEKDRIGGTCLNRGCIPTKVLLHTAKLYSQAQKFSKFGISVENLSLDFQKVQAHKDGVVNKLNAGVEYLLKKNGVQVIRGEAQFLSRGELLVTGKDSEQKIPVDNVIIATGSQPSELPFAHRDGQIVLNSNDALELGAPPASMAIIGGGVIGCEFAQAFARFGCKVTVLESLDRLIANMDSDVSKYAKQILEKSGVKVLLKAQVEKMEPCDNGAAIFYKSPDGQSKEIFTEKVLIATGRKPTSDTLNVQAAGVIHANGAITVDPHMRTNIAGIYAIGDVTGGMQLAHVASHQACVAVDNLFGKINDMHYFDVPVCIYTDPEIASVGMTEEEAKERGLSCAAGRFPVAGNGKALIEDCTDGFCKVIREEDSGRILGIHLVGPNVTEMVSLLGPFIQSSATTDAISRVIFAHPTVSEIIHEGVLDTQGLALHK